MFFKMFNVVKFFYLMCIFCLPIPSWSIGITHSPLPATPCPPGSVNTQPMVGTVCATHQSADETGVLMFGPGARYIPGVMDTYTGYFDNLYAPQRGNYRVRVFICPVLFASKCTIKNSIDSIDGAKQLSLLSTSVPIGKLDLDAGGPSRSLTISYPHSICVALVDTKGIAWAGDDGMACSDGNILPSVPAACYLNYNNTSLNVDMGVLERSKISTAPSTAQNIKKSISVLCTRDAGTDVSFQFQYSWPSIVSGNKLISTQLNGISVAIIYEGKIVSPSQVFQRKFPAGYSQLDIEFAAIRDPNIALGDIGTGKFSANAVLIMTEM